MYLNPGNNQDLIALCSNLINLQKFKLFFEKLKPKINKKSKNFKFNNSFHKFLKKDSIESGGIDSNNSAA